jgi:hypothetical protein
MADELQEYLESGGLKPNPVLNQAQQKPSSVVSTTNADPLQAFMESGGTSANPVSQRIAPVVDYNKPAPGTKPMRNRSFVEKMKDVANAIDHNLVMMGSQFEGGLAALTTPGSIATRDTAARAANETAMNEQDPYRVRPESRTEGSLGYSNDITGVMGSKWNPFNWVPNMMSAPGRWITEGATQDQSAEARRAIDQRRPINIPENGGFFDPTVWGPSLEGAGQVAGQMLTPRAWQTTKFGTRAIGKGITTGSGVVARTTRNALGIPGPNSAIVAADTIAGRTGGSPANTANNPSVGAAGNPQPVDIQHLPQEMQERVAQAIENEEPINIEALGRHARGALLNPPVRYTRGHATQDPAIMGEEWNSRHANGMENDYETQATALQENITNLDDAVRNGVVRSNGDLGHGTTLVDSIKNRLLEIRRNVGSAYDNWRDLAKKYGGDMGGDTAAWVKNVRSKVADDPLLQHELENNPSFKGLKTILKKYENGAPMTYGEYESTLRTLGKMSASGDSVGHAAGIIRGELNDIPLSDQANPEILAAANRARALWKRHKEMEQTYPWYRRVSEHISSDPKTGNFKVNDNALDQLKDRFVEQNIANTGSSTHSVQRLSDFLSGDEQAQRTIGTALFDRLKDASKVANGNFAAAGFNNELANLRPKLDAILDPEHLDWIDRLGETAKDVIHQKRSSISNPTNSGAAANQVARVAAENSLGTQIGNDVLGSIVVNAGPKGILAAKGLQLGRAITKSARSNAENAAKSNLAAARRRKATGHESGFDEDSNRFDFPGVFDHDPPLTNYIPKEKP